MSSRCPKTDFLPIALCIATALFMGDAAEAATAVPCLDGTAKPLLDKTLDVGAAPQRVTLPATKDSDLLVQVVEEGIDVEAALQDA